MVDNISIPNVSAASIIAMIVTLIISVGLPIALCIIVWRKTRARISSFFIGAATFIVFALILEQILHTVVLSVAPNLRKNIWLYALYGGLAAGIFEETGRFLAMKFCMKKNLNKQNAIMYGVGHGGIEAILLTGMTYFSNLVVSLMINSGQISAILSMSGVDDSNYQLAISQLMVMGTTPSWQFYMAGVERISAIIFHISASYLVYLAVKEKKLLCYLLAILLHFLLDALALITAVYLPVLAVELILILFSGVFGFIVWKLYHMRQDAYPDQKS